MSTSSAALSHRSTRADQHPRRSSELDIRKAEAVDLDSINALIGAAINTWQLSDRIKRISLPLYRYENDDLEHQHIVVAESDPLGLVGVAAIEAADAAESPWAINAALLHGLYVDPRQHRSGLGSLLLGHMETLASALGFDGLLVKAQREAAAFFEARGYEKLPVEDYSRNYPHRYWKSF